MITHTNPVNENSGIQLYPTLATDTKNIELKKTDGCRFQLVKSQGEVVFTFAAGPSIE